MERRIIEYQVALDRAPVKLELAGFISLTLVYSSLDPDSSGCYGL